MMPLAGGNSHRERPVTTIGQSTACTQIGGSNATQTKNTRGTVMTSTTNITNTAGPSPVSRAL